MPSHLRRFGSALKMSAQINCAYTRATSIKPGSWIRLPESGAVAGAKVRLRLQQMSEVPPNNALHQTKRGGAPASQAVVEARFAGERECWAGYWARHQVLMGER